MLSYETISNVLSSHHSLAADIIRSRNTSWHPCKCGVVMSSWQANLCSWWQFFFCACKAGTERTERTALETSLVCLEYLIKISDGHYLLETNSSKGCSLKHSVLNWGDFYNYWKFGYRQILWKQESFVFPVMDEIQCKICFSLHLSREGK